MSMVGSRTNDGLDLSSHHRSDRPADGRRCGHASARRAPPYPEGRAEPDGHGGDSRHGAYSAARERDGGDRRWRYCTRLPARGLGCALWHRACGGPIVHADGRTGQRARSLRPHLRAGAVGPGRPSFPCAVPAADDGGKRRLSDRRPVQSVRLLRDHARSVIRAGPARLRPPADPSGSGLYCRQSDGLAAVPDRGEPDLRRDRDPQHGRSGGAHPRHHAR